MAGSRLVARIGVVAAVVIAGLLLTAPARPPAASPSHVISLFAATVVMGAGVAVTQPAMPALVGRWLPDRLVLGTGVYTNGLLVGEILPGRAVPLLFPAFGGSWRATFVLWAVPIVAIAVLCYSSWRRAQRARRAPTLQRAGGPIGPRVAYLAAWV